MSDIPKDIIISSRKAKELFLDRCNELNIIPEALCKHVGIKRESFELWQRAIDPDDAIKAMPQSDLIRLLEGVYVSLQVVLITKPIESIPKEDRDFLVSVSSDFSSGI